MRLEIFINFYAGGGTRTLMGITSQWILSPQRLPIPPPRHFDF